MSLSLIPSAEAQILPSLFPEGIPGSDTAQGVTVQSRLHPDFAPVGLHEGSFQVFPSIDETFGYNSNLLPGSARRGSWQVTTAPALIFGSDWSRDQVGGAVTVQDTRYLSLPSQDRTDVTASVGSRIDIGDDQLTVAAAHSSGHEDRGEINTIISDRPIAFQFDDLRVAYTLNDGRWSLTPKLDVANWTYDNTTIQGLPTNQAYRDRVVGQGDLTLRYEWAPLRNILLVARALGQDYTHIPTGQPSSNSQSYQFLAGFDFDDNSVWRWRLLLGGEARAFTASVYHPQNTLIAEAEASWSPSPMTTIHASLSRETQDASQEGVAGLVYSTARLTIDHEYMRNVLLGASAGVQQADYFQGGRQTGFTAGAGVTWLLNRSMRISLTYDQTDLHGGRRRIQRVRLKFVRFDIRGTIPGDRIQPQPVAHHLSVCSVTQSVPLLGLDFADLTVEEAASQLADRHPLASFAYVVTANADHLVRVATDGPLRLIYRDAVLCLLDSRVVSGLAHLLGLAAPQVATGSDLTERLLTNHVRRGERVTIVGLAPVWLTTLCERYELADPAHFDPPKGFDRDPVAFAATVAFVCANPARFIFLAVGSPRQEQLAAAVAATGRATGTALCIGASLEYLTGAQRRAPVAVQHIGLEWLFRLITNPRRMARRYLIDSPRIIGLMLRQRRLVSRAGRAPPAGSGS